MVTSVLVSLKACQHLGAGSKHVQTLVHIIPLFEWSVLKLIKILEPWQSVNLIGVLIRSFQPSHKTQVLLPATDSQTFRLRGGSPTGYSELVLCPQG